MFTLTDDMARQPGFLHEAGRLGQGTSCLIGRGSTLIGPGGKPFGRGAEPLRINHWVPGGEHTSIWVGRALKGSWQYLFKNLSRENYVPHEARTFSGDPGNCRMDDFQLESLVGLDGRSRTIAYIFEARMQFCTNISFS